MPPRTPVSASSRLLACLTLFVVAELVGEMEVDEDLGAAPKTPGEPDFCSAPCRFIRGV